MFVILLRIRTIFYKGAQSYRLDVTVQASVFRLVFLLAQNLLLLALRLYLLIFSVCCTMVSLLLLGKRKISGRKQLYVSVPFFPVTNLLYSTVCLVLLTVYYYTQPYEGAVCFFFSGVGKGKRNMIGQAGTKLKIFLGYFPKDGW